MAKSELSVKLSKPTLFVERSISSSTVLQDRNFCASTKGIIASNPETEAGECSTMVKLMHEKMFHLIRAYHMSNLNLYMEIWPAICSFVPQLVLLG